MAILAIYAAHVSFWLMRKVFSPNTADAGHAWATSVCLGIALFIPILGFVWTWYLLKGYRERNELAFTKSKAIGMFIAYVFASMLIISVLTVVVRNYGCVPYRMSGNSMAPTLTNGQFIGANKFAYVIGEPARGDMVIITPHASNNKAFYAQRIIGLPGDKIRLQSGAVMIRESNQTEFHPLDESYLPADMQNRTAPGQSSGTSDYSVPAGAYFTLGDNRTGSADSRDCYMSCKAL